MENHNDELRHRNLGLALVLVVWCLFLGHAEAKPEGKDHRLKVKIDKQVTVMPAGPGVGRAMLSIARHPCGTIFVNPQHGPLYRSNDDGQTWVAVPVKLPNAPPGQVLHGFHINRDGRMWLMHQTSPADLFVSYSTDIGRKWKTTPIDYTELPPGGSPGDERWRRIPRSGSGSGGRS